MKLRQINADTFEIKYQGFRGVETQHFDRASLTALALQACSLLGLLPWRPIAELDERTRYGDEAGFLLLAPELVDLDCNAHGVGMGFFQDDGLKWNASQEACDAWPDDKPASSWLANKWDMSHDEWRLVSCTPTHYLRLTGAGS